MPQQSNSDRFNSARTATLQTGFFARDMTHWPGWGEACTDGSGVVGGNRAELLLLSEGGALGIVMLLMGWDEMGHLEWCRGTVCDMSRGLEHGKPEKDLHKVT